MAKSFDEITRCLSVEDQKVIKDMMALFDGIDRQTGAFARQTGLKCKSGCGACCMSPEVETTVAEVLPLAVYLWAQGLVRERDAGDAINGVSTVCAFYRPAPPSLTLPTEGEGIKDSSPHGGGGNTQGRCGVYAFRPGLCRLFGFAARHDKYGKPALVTCKIIKDGQAKECQRTQDELQKGTLNAPLLNTHALSVANIDPVHGQKLLPINQAISQAVAKVGLQINLNKNC